MTTEEEKLENTRKLFANSKNKGIDQRQTRFYHSILDPEGKVITEEGPDGIKLYLSYDTWKAFVSNTWIKEKK